MGYINLSYFLVVQALLMLGFESEKYTRTDWSFIYTKIYLLNVSHNKFSILNWKRWLSGLKRQIANPRINPAFITLWKRDTVRKGRINTINLGLLYLLHLRNSSRLVALEGIIPPIDFRYHQTSCLHHVILRRTLLVIGCGRPRLRPVRPIQVV